MAAVSALTQQARKRKAPADIEECDDIQELRELAQQLAERVEELEEQMAELKAKAKKQKTASPAAAPAAVIHDRRST